MDEETIAASNAAMTFVDSLPIKGGMPDGHALGVVSTSARRSDRLWSGRPTPYTGGIAWA
jgi:hypothetical protein